MIYTVTVKFQADRELNEQQKEWLLGSIQLQIQEPQNYAGDDLDYTTVLQGTTIEGEKEGER